MKRILAVGGGSGGHVTPVVSVLRELKKDYPKVEVRFWCDVKFAPQAKRIINEYDPNLKVQRMISGKFRRYSHLSKIQHILIPSVLFPNIRDAFYVLLGVVQSILHLLFWRPDVVFAKGGYVCLPVGIAAFLLRIPLVIHDSDAVPGLTNRLLAPFAKRIATGVPLSHYNYPPEKSVYVGIPIDSRYKVINFEEQRELKKSFGFNADRPLTVFTGGGLGSRTINTAVATQLHDLLKITNVLLISGASQYDELRSLTPDNDDRFVLKDFMPGLREALSAADIVVSRAGATALLELAALAKPTILVPSKRLNWQVKHAQIFVDEGAVLPLDENEFEIPGDRSLVDAVDKLVKDTTYRKKLGTELHNFARPHAARDMATLIVQTARKR